MISDKRILKVRYNTYLNQTPFMAKFEAGCNAVSDR